MSGLSEAERVELREYVAAQVRSGLIAAVERIVAARVASAEAENARLRARIEGLAEEFGAIGSRTPLGQGTPVDVAWCEAARRLRAVLVPDPQVTEASQGEVGGL